VIGEAAAQLVRVLADRLDIALGGAQPAASVGS